jgi:hypothetical protein
LHTTSKNDWPQTELHTESPQDWLQTCKGREWLKTHDGRSWLQIESGRDWLQTQSGQGWLQTPDGHAWQSTLPASVWLTIEEFSITLEAINEQMIASEMPLLPVFQVIQQFMSLPDFLMFPVFLALRHQDHSSTALLLPQGSRPPDLDIIHAMKAFVDFANAERERLTSDALKYACQNWAFHLSRAHPGNDELNRIFKLFWDSHLSSWFERQWCLKGLLSCLHILSEGHKNAKVRGYIDSYHLCVWEHVTFSVGVRRSGEWKTTSDQVLRAQSWSSVVWARIIPAMFNNDMVLFLLYPYVKRPSPVV